MQVLVAGYVYWALKSSRNEDLQYLICGLSGV